eukprot:Colp12_sorted_trinity150504_noHs@19304
MAPSSLVACSYKPLPPPSGTSSLSSSAVSFMPSSGEAPWSSSGGNTRFKRRCHFSLTLPAYLKGLGGSCLRGGGGWSPSSSRCEPPISCVAPCLLSPWLTPPLPWGFSALRAEGGCCCRCLEAFLLSSFSAEFSSSWALSRASVPSSLRTPKVAGLVPSDSLGGASSSPSSSSFFSSSAFSCSSCRSGRSPAAPETGLFSMSGGSLPSSPLSSGSSGLPCASRGWSSGCSGSTSIASFSSSSPPLSSSSPPSRFMSSGRSSPPSSLFSGFSPSPSPSAGMPLSPASSPSSRSFSSPPSLSRSMSSGPSSPPSSSWGSGFSSLRTSMPMGLSIVPSSLSSLIWLSSGRSLPGFWSSGGGSSASSLCSGAFWSLSAAGSSSGLSLPPSSSSSLVRISPSMASPFIFESFSNFSSSLPWPSSPLSELLSSSSHCFSSTMSSALASPISFSGSSPSSSSDSSFLFSSSLGISNISPSKS